MLDVNPKRTTFELAAVLSNRVVEGIVGWKVRPEILQDPAHRQGRARIEPYQAQTGASVVTRSGQHSRQPPLGGRLKRGDRQRARAIPSPAELGPRGLGTPLSLAADTSGLPGILLQDFGLHSEQILRVWRGSEHRLRYGGRWLDHAVGESSPGC